MSSLNRASRLGAQISLLLALVATGTYVLLRPYLDDQERLYDQGRVDEIVKQGPLTIGHVEWKLDSLKAYTKLIDDEGEEISMGQPAGSVIMVATLTVTPREGLYLKDHGFSCSATLRDDRGNNWAGQQPFDFPLPTFCSDDDHPFTMDKPGQVAQVYVVPASAVPHLTGLVLENLDERRRVLLTP